MDRGGLSVVRVGVILRSCASNRVARRDLPRHVRSSAKLARIWDYFLASNHLHLVECTHVLTPCEVL